MVRARSSPGRRSTHERAPAAPRPISAARRSHREGAGARARPACRGRWPPAPTRSVDERLHAQGAAADLLRLLELLLGPASVAGGGELSGLPRSAAPTSARRARRLGAAAGRRVDGGRGARLHQRHQDLRMQHRRVDHVMNARPPPNRRGGDEPAERRRPAPLPRAPPAPAGGADARRGRHSVPLTRGDRALTPGSPPRPRTPLLAGRYERERRRRAARAEALGDSRGSTSSASITSSSDTLMSETFEERH